MKTTPATNPLAPNPGARDGVAPSRRRAPSVATEPAGGAPPAAATPSAGRRPPAFVAPRAGRISPASATAGRG
eukprot:145421-Lingulodinium_polyedra.AAC.1